MGADPRAYVETCERSEERYEPPRCEPWDETCMKCMEPKMMMSTLPCDEQAHFLKKQCFQFIAMAVDMSVNPENKVQGLCPKGRRLKGERKERELNLVSEITSLAPAAFGSVLYKMKSNRKE